MVMTKACGMSAATAGQKVKFGPKRHAALQRTSKAAVAMSHELQFESCFAQAHISWSNNGSGHF